MNKWMMIAVLIAGSSLARADAGMYAISIDSVRAQPLGDDGKLAGTPVDVAFKQTGTIGCHLDADPKGAALEPWVQGTVDDAGTLHTDVEPKAGGAAKDVATCARSVLINNKLDVKRGRYRVLTKVSFRRLAS